MEVVATGPSELELFLAVSLAFNGWAVPPALELGIIDDRECWLQGLLEQFFVNEYLSPFGGRQG